MGTRRYRGKQPLPMGSSRYQREAAATCDLCCWGPHAHLRVCLVSHNCLGAAVNLLGKRMEWASRDGVGAKGEPKAEAGSRSTRQPAASRLYPGNSDRQAGQLNGLPSDLHSKTHKVDEAFALVPVHAVWQQHLLCCHHLCQLSAALSCRGEAGWVQVGGWAVQEAAAAPLLVPITSPSSALHHARAWVEAGEGGWGEQLQRLRRHTNTSSAGWPMGDAMHGWEAAGWVGVQEPGRQRQQQRRYSGSKHRLRTCRGQDGTAARAGRPATCCACGPPEGCLAETPCRR